MLYSIDLANIRKDCRFSSTYILFTSPPFWESCIHDRIIFKILLLTHKAVNNTAPKYVCDLIRLNVKSTTIRTRASFDPCLLCVPPISKTCANSLFDKSFVYAAPTLWNALDLDIRLLPFDTFKKSVKTHLYLKYFVNWFLLYLYYLYDISVSTMCIYCDYCVYHYKSTELVSLYTLDIGLKINIIIIIIFYRHQVKCIILTHNNDG